MTAVSSVAFSSLRLQGQVFALQKRSRISQSASTLGCCSLVNCSVSPSVSGTSPFEQGSGKPCQYEVYLPLAVIAGCHLLCSVGIGGMCGLAVVSIVSGGRESH